MAGSVRVGNGKALKDEMRIKVKDHDHYRGEGGPEKQSGREGPDKLPGRKER